MLVGYMRVSSESGCQNTKLQVADFNAWNLYEDRASGFKDDRPGFSMGFVCASCVLA